MTSAAIKIAMSRALPLDRVEAGGEVLQFVPPADGIPQDAQIYLATALDPLDAGRIERLPDSIRLIANLGVGFDNIDLAAASARGLLISNTPVVTEDTADLAFGLILAAARRISESERFLRAGKWQSGVDMPPLGTRVHGARLGVIGFGAIGQAVVRRARGFGMEILYYSRTEKPDAAQALGAHYCSSLINLLAESDIVTLHAPLNADTRGMIGAGELSQCKQGAVIVNTARGALINDDALVAALKSGHIAAAGLDVYPAEPHVPQGLLALDQVVLTPHIGSATMQCRRDMVERAIANIVSFAKTGAPRDAVSLPQPAGT